MVRRRVRLIDPSVTEGAGLAGVLPYAQMYAAQAIGNAVVPMVEKLGAIPDIPKSEREAYLNSLLEHYVSPRNLLYRPLASVAGKAAGQGAMSVLGSAFKLAGRAGSAVFNPFGKTFVGTV